MSESFDDLCPKPARVPPSSTEPLVPPIYLSTVYRCSDPHQADAVLAGSEAGYVYSRDAHPNGDMLAQRCCELHGAARAAICTSGMSALALAMLSQLASGDHLIASSMLYGRSLVLLRDEARRLGIECSVVDTCDLSAVTASIGPRTRLVVAETITNPLLRVTDLKQLADIAHARGALLLVDNTLAGPGVCQPMMHGADLVMESMTKSMNGHSDVLLGLLCAREASSWTRVPQAASSWGLTASPLECWLAMRGLATLAVRIDRACENALAVARLLAGRVEVKRVSYPGLAQHPDHALAARQLAGKYGTLVTMDLAGGSQAAERFMKAVPEIPFCPSLGELSSTLSHPESTSHRSLTPEARMALGITGGTVRLSLGIESTGTIVAAISRGLDSLR